MIEGFYIVVLILIGACLWITERQASRKRLEWKIRWYWRHNPRALRAYLDGKIADLPEPAEFD